MLFLAMILTMNVLVICIAIGIMVALYEQRKDIRNKTIAKVLKFYKDVEVKNNGK